MKEKKENKLDQLFKDGISGSEDRIVFREEDWASMEQLLDGKSSKKAGVLRFIYYASAIAALLLLAIGLYFFNNKDKATSNQTKLYGNTKKQPKTNNNPVQPATPQDTGMIAVNKGLNNNVTPGQNNNPVAPLAGNHTGHYSPVNNNVVVKPSGTNTTKDSVALYNNLVNNTNVTPKDKRVVNNTNATATNQIASAGNQVQNGVAANTTPDTVTEVQQPVQQSNKALIAANQKFKTRPQFSLSVLAAPDVNAVNSFNRSQVGTNFGLQLSVRISKKFSISTGAAYAVKPYEAGFSSYKAAYNSPIDPTNVYANCKVLDIPLNMSYQVYSRGKNALALGTGLSSYFMLRENYRFDYSPESGWAPHNLEIKNQNQHLFGVLNVNATYQRQINSKFSAVVQPYMKLPLTGIGNGRVDLKSTGVALGVSWNLNSVFKPK
ncbi:hypothetical protein SAMN05216464_101197 [Mucilaginibacter pineti]|uniref:Outer membrane protein beta-barrel domain-containing protein n=1 Tax=Mucilaginibacter pineti TaxID=1391627 RepID=A0A1G6T6C6_9SPHI|nr:hypothetical protein [Mucilaginibacter pineti]SDD24702.1 hypothetical protein SAMN05216464_101197 [Mucilaginibacter pineti]